MLYPSESSPQSFQWAALMTAKPTAAEGILTDDHRQTNHHGVCDAYLIVTAKTIAAEDEDTPQGIGHIDSGVWEMTGLIHD